MKSAELARPVRTVRSGRGGRPWFVLPLVVVMAATTLFPIGYALVVSLFDWNWGSRFNFVGVDNYVDVAGRATFWWSVVRTALFAITAVGIEVVLGLVLAVVVHRASRGIGALRTLLMLPMMVSGMVVSLVWKIMLDPSLGVISTNLSGLFGFTVDPLGDKATALIALAAIDAWWQTGFVFIVLSAALAALPKEPFEAAWVDGASRAQAFRAITLPLLLPTILTVAAIRLVDCLKVFALIYGTTEGGPANATEVTQILVYRGAFKEFAMSESMTMMVMYSALVLVLVAGAYVIAKKGRFGAVK